ncbi:hypothetical protein FV242_28070 [Methylobacterium sp. WL64]|uniref:hypothetical protein n=1 Tax=Methylobacterium sp. WL64 TaxID=2603894 RepID=UPI0011C950A0|nr:hypothetical protein [Methylobacterium sp. WL64]TXM98650.1 hypothetical protein FV242_28070 [Methylobacterium sp. WL64]
MSCARIAAASVCAFISQCGPLLAQWSASGGLLNVSITKSCSETSGNIATSKSDGLFLCPTRISLVESQVKGASHFYIVHAYGLLAIRNNSERLADCWAAHQLANAPNGLHYIKQWITHWSNYGVTQSTFGTPAQRIANVRSCCACGI